MSTKALNYRQQQFCKHYLRCGRNASEAARKAGYSEKGVNVTACQLLTKTNIKEEIERLKQNIEETTGITKERVVLEHMKLAFTSIAHLHNTWIERKEFEQLTDDQKSCIAEISTRILKKNIGTGMEPDIVDVEEIKVKLFDKQKALDSISKLLSYDAPLKIDLPSGVIQFVNVSKQFP